MTKVKISKEALHTTLFLWEEYLAQLEAGKEVEVGRCTVCSEVSAVARQQYKDAHISHRYCAKYCPFHSRVCCNTVFLHKRKPLYWKFIFFCEKDRPKAIKYAKLIIKAIQEQLEVSS